VVELVLGDEILQINLLLSFSSYVDEADDPLQLKADQAKVVVQVFLCYSNYLLVIV
jgi:hypothetical protein